MISGDMLYAYTAVVFLLGFTVHALMLQIIDGVIPQWLDKHGRLIELEDLPEEVLSFLRDEPPLVHAELVMDEPMQPKRAMHEPTVAETVAEIVKEAPEEEIIWPIEWLLKSPPSLTAPPPLRAFNRYVPSLQLAARLAA